MLPKQCCDLNYLKYTNFRVRLVSSCICFCRRDLFYVRNHLPVPEVDLATYELEVSGIRTKDVTLKLDDIKKFPKYTVTAAIQCAGNRRSEMSQVNVYGLLFMIVIHPFIFKTLPSIMLMIVIMSYKFNNPSFHFL